MSIVDIAISCAMMWTIGWLVGRLLRKSERRHAWGELNSADVASAIRRVQRPR